MDNTECLLAFNRMEGVGPRTVEKLLKHFPNPSELFRLSAEALASSGLPPVLCSGILDFDRKTLEADHRFRAVTGNHLLTRLDPEYPPLLREIHDPPPVLYARGNLRLLHLKTLAIIGTRRPSHTGAETAYAFAGTLASCGLSIVSGLARGIDACAHRGALAAKGPTIAVMGTGMDRIYPREHQHLAEEIAENGLILSEFPLGTPPAAGHFPRRNRIISGLSLATLVVEAAVRSGSLVTARLAMEQNRDVFAIPGSIYSPEARGCHHLLQQGARLVTSPADVLEEFSLQPQPENHVQTASLATADENLVKCVGFEVTAIDTIVTRSGLTIEQVACGLTNLELQGIIHSVPGGYVRCSV